MLSAVVLVFIGAGLGGVARYAVWYWLQRDPAIPFAWGTVAVNISGSLLIGLIIGLTGAGAETQRLRLFLVTGLLGGYTTFSAFSLEGIHYLRHGNAEMFLLHFLANTVGGLFACYAGWKAGTAFSLL